ncbi:MAG: CoA pyrophosphatase [Mobilicoccus sp.]|nr:CoA pyrophosphatase [Mobilicoccus sp.]
MSAPSWLTRVATSAGEVSESFFTVHRPGGRGERESAVLVLVGPDEDDELGSVILTERSSRLRSHSGQIAFPGGRVDPEDDGPIDAALREAHEEVGLTRRGVEVLTTFPALHVPVSNSEVTPVLAWWREPADIGVHSPTEVERVLTVGVSRLVDPAHRFTVTHPVGYRGVGFEVDDLFIWGFTAAVLDRLFALGDVAPVWDPAVHRELPERVSAGRAPMVSDTREPR